MNYKQAQTYLKRAEKNGFNRYHSGIVSQEVQKRFSGNVTGISYGINIDGDGSKGKPFGCPQIIWDAETAEQMFPTRIYRKGV
jgi:hypothetical protein